MLGGGGEGLHRQGRRHVRAERPQRLAAAVPRQRAAAGWTLKAVEANVTDTGIDFKAAKP
jgi:hypothetical protein